jgi:hypothetical protein
MNQNRRKMLKGSGMLFTALALSPVLTGCVGPRGRGGVHSGGVHGRLNWAGPNILLIPITLLFIGSTLLLPDGKKAEIKKVHKKKVDVIINNTESSYAYKPDT